MNDDYSTANRQAAKVAYIYLVISGVWILAGDHLTALVPAELYSASLFPNYESWFVVLMTAGFIYFPVRSGYRALIRSREAHLDKVGRGLKRDLTALAGLIDLHVGEYNNRGSKTALISMQSRLRTLSRIYELFLEYGSDHTIPFQQVTGHMKTNNFSGLNIYCDELYLSANQAVTLGLLLNEIIIPFVPDRQKEEFPITVAIKNSQNSTITVIFRLVESPDYYHLINRIQNKGDHLEGKLIHTFTQKLGGTSSWKKTNGRVTYQIRFKKEQNS